MKNGYSMNPQTGRIIKKTTAKYKKLVKLGLIKEEEPTEAQQPIQQPPPQPIPPPPVKAEVAKECVNLVKQNEDKFRDLTQKETDKLLRKLLIEKLAPKKKKKKKKKYYVSSSESESSDSD